MPSAGLSKALMLSVALHAGVLGAVYWSWTSLAGGPGASSAQARAVTVSLSRLPSAVAVRPAPVDSRDPLAPLATPETPVAPAVRSASVSEQRILEPIEVDPVTAHRAVPRRQWQRAIPNVVTQRAVARALAPPATRRPLAQRAVQRATLAHARSASAATSNPKRIKAQRVPARKRVQQPPQKRVTTAKSPVSAAVNRAREHTASKQPAATQLAVHAPATTIGTAASAGRIAASRAPRPASGNVAPRYPRLARRRGLQGRVVLTLEVSAGGTPQKTTVAKSSGVKMLDDAAREAVSRWRFEPALEAGRAVPAKVQVPIVFRLDRNG